MEALILSGALDTYNMSRTQMFARYNLFDSLSENERSVIIKYNNHNWVDIVRALADENRAQVMKEQWNVKIPNSRRRETLQENIRVFDASDPFDSKAQKFLWEREILGISLTGDEVGSFNATNTCVEILNYGSEDMFMEVAVRLEKVKKHLTKVKKEEMAFLTVTDNTSKLDNFVVFPKTWDKYKNILLEGSILKIKGIISKQGSFIVNKLEKLR
jgi:DNA polymerase III alpha subunit